jgi:hypothetical protein
MVGQHSYYNSNLKSFKNDQRPRILEYYNMGFPKYLSRINTRKIEDTKK